MIYPDIKSYHDDLREKHFMLPLSDRPHFMGRDAFDVRWRKARGAANVQKDGDSFVLEVLLPGFKKEEIEVSIANDTLRVRAEHKHHAEVPEMEYVLQEFDCDILERKFRLAQGVSSDQIDARFADGILKVVFRDVPTRRERTHRVIAVN